MNESPQHVDVARARQILEQAEAADRARNTSRYEAEAAALLAIASEIAPALDLLTEVDLDAALRLAGVTSLLWQDAGLVDVGRNAVERAIAVVGDEPLAALARAVLTAADLAFRQGDQAAAVDRAERAIRIAESVGDRSIASLAHTDLARVALRAGAAADIERHAREALVLASDDPLGRRGALHMLAWAAHTAGDMPEARRRFAASLALRRTLEDRFSISVELSNLGDLSAAAGDRAAGARAMTEALVIAQELQSRYLIVNLLPSFATLALDEDRLSDAVRLLGASDRAAESAGLLADPGGYGVDTRDRLLSLVDAQWFDQLHREGASLSDDDAITLARAVAEEIDRANA
ncbi:MAG: hypothetical protein ABI553_05300 [Chloroflexota bacterium]